MREMLSIAFTATHDQSAAAVHRQHLRKDASDTGHSGLQPPLASGTDAQPATAPANDTDKPKSKRKRTRRRRNKGSRVKDDATAATEESAVVSTNTTATAVASAADAVDTAAPPSNRGKGGKSSRSKSSRSGNGAGSNGNNNGTVAANGAKKKQHDKPMTKRDLYFSLKVSMVAIAGGAQSVGRVTLVNWDGEVVLDKHVQVPVPVVDLHGICADALLADNGAVQFAAARSQVGSLLRGKILVGHSLDRSLMALGLSHPWSDVRDTATYPRFRIATGTDPVSGRSPSHAVNARPTIEALVQSILNRDLSAYSHNSGNTTCNNTPSKPRRGRKSKKDRRSNGTECDNGGDRSNVQLLTHDRKPILECMASLDLYKTFRKEWEQDLVDRMAQQQPYYNDGGNPTPVDRGPASSSGEAGPVDHTAAIPLQLAGGYLRPRGMSYDSCSSYDGSVYSNPSTNISAHSHMATPASGNPGAGSSQSWSWLHRGKYSKHGREESSVASLGNSHDGVSETSSYYGSHQEDSFHDHSSDSFYVQANPGGAGPVSLAAVGSDSLVIPAPPAQPPASSSSWFPRFGGSKKARHPMASVLEVDEMQTMASPIRFDHSITPAPAVVGVADPHAPSQAPPSVPSKGWFPFRRKSSFGKRRTFLDGPMAPPALDRITDCGPSSLDPYVQKNDATVDHTAATTAVNNENIPSDSATGVNGPATNHSVLSSSDADSVGKSSSPAKWFGLRRSSSTGPKKTFKTTGAVTAETMHGEEKQEKQTPDDATDSDADYFESWLPENLDGPLGDGEVEIEEEDESFDPSGHYGAASRKHWKAKQAAAAADAVAAGTPPSLSSTPTGKSSKWFGFRRPKSPGSAQSTTDFVSTGVKAGQSGTVMEYPPMKVPDNPWTLTPKSKSVEHAVSQDLSGNLDIGTASNNGQSGVGATSSEPRRDATSEAVSEEKSANVSNPPSRFSFRRWSMTGGKNKSTEAEQQEANEVSSSHSGAPFSAGVSQALVGDSYGEENSTLNDLSRSEGGGKNCGASELTKSSSWFNFRRSSKKKGPSDKSSTDSLLSAIERDRPYLLANPRSTANERWPVQAEILNVSSTEHLPSGELQPARTNGVRDFIEKDTGCNSPTQSESAKTLSTTTTGTDWFDEVVHGRSRTNTAASSVDMELSRSSGLELVDSSGVFEAETASVSLPDVSQQLPSSLPRYQPRTVSRLAAASKDCDDTDDTNMKSACSGNGVTSPPRTAAPSPWLDEVTVNAGKGSMEDIVWGPAWFERSSGSGASQRPPALSSDDAMEHSTSPDQRGLSSDLESTMLHLQI